MPFHDPEAHASDRVETVEAAFGAALNGDVSAVSSLLADDVRWCAAGGDPSAGCTNRRQALVWLQQTVARGIRAELLDVQALDENRVLVRLRRRAPGNAEPASEPHGQIVTFRGEEVSEILVYPTYAEALAAAQSR